MCVCVCVCGKREWRNFGWKRVELPSFTGIVIGVAGALLIATVLLTGGIIKFLIAHKQCTDLR